MFKDELDCTLGFYFNNPIQYIEQIDTIEKYIKAILNSFYRVLEKQILGKYFKPQEKDDETLSKDVNLFIKLNKNIDPNDLSDEAA